MERKREHASILKHYREDEKRSMAVQRNTVNKNKK
jgi:hypothetical protein